MELDETFHRACSSGNLDQVKQLIRQGNVSNPRDVSHLLIAIYHKHRNIVRFLLDNGVNPQDDVGRFRESPFFVAIRTNQYDIVNDLINAGVDVNRPNVYGIYPLHYACQEGSLRAVQALLEHGASLESTTHQQQTPLMVAISWSNHHPNPDSKDRRQIIHMLVQHGATFHTKDKSGNTPLHVAAMLPTPTVLQALLLYPESHELIDVQNRYGETPLHIAASHLNEKNVNLLLQYGANQTIQNSKKKTARQIDPSSFRQFDQQQLSSKILRKNIFDRKNTPAPPLVQYDKTRQQQQAVKHHLSVINPDVLPELFGLMYGPNVQSTVGSERKIVQQILRKRQASLNQSEKRLPS